MALNVGQPKPIKYEFDADASKFARGARQVEQGLEKIGRQAMLTDSQLDLEVDVDDSALNTLRLRLLAAKRQLQDDIKADVDLDAGAALVKLRTIERQLRQLDRMDVKPEVHIDYDRSLLGRLTTGFQDAGIAARGIANSFAGLPPQLAAVAGGIGVVASALAAPVAVGTAGALLAGGIAAGGFKFLEEVAEIEAASRKFKTVFEDQAQTIIDWSQAVSVRGGVGARQLQEIAAGVQDLLVPRGYSRSVAASITREIVERGIALAEFSGADKAYGIESVTKALLGEREQLKGLGVQIRQSDINDWIKDNAKSLEGMSKGQQEVAATLALLKQNSTDAWAAYTEGGSNAEQTLDTIRATMANLKDAALVGLAGIFSGILDDLIATTGGFDNLNQAAANLSEWIQTNRGAIRNFMLDIADAALAGVEAFAAVGGAIPEIGRQIALLLPDSIRFAAAMVDISEKAAALSTIATVTIGTQEWRDAWKVLASDTSDRVREMEASADRLEDRFNAWDFSGSKAAMENLGQWASEARDVLDTLRVSDVRIVLETSLDKGGKEQVKRDLKELTDDQIVDILADLQGSDDKVDRRLRRLTEREWKARIEALLRGDKKVETDLRALARDRDAYINVKYRLPPGGPFGNKPLPPLSPASLPGGITAFGAGSARALTATAYAPWPTGYRQGTVFAPTVNNYYPEPERASDALAASLRAARYAVGV